MRHGSTCLESPSLALPPCEVGGEDLHGLTSLEISHRKRNQGSFKSGNPRFTKEGERKFTTCFQRPVELAVLREAQCERKLEHKTHATR
ncbi:hypothetical protein chiPu_0006658 [Chiloscyllium punctatum]|uniref:Uncharacterized protein n=1 Tax=Chiloscyllium punctatum TaxID=137246 RepID=A0A401SCU7_CHIPU|nr:hypothetical protein [Chiloscyllium punctatum]